jgi:putative ABC transport system permease protein
VTVLDRKLRREIRVAALRLLAITSIIAVGVACYVEMDSCHQNLTDAKDGYYAQCRMADFSIDLKKAPLADLAVIASLEGVQEIRPRIQFFATVDLENHLELLNGQVISLPDEHVPIINDIQLKRGSYFTPTRDNEVIVNDAFARKHKLQPGQWIHLILNNRRQELFIVGTAVSSEFVYLVGPGSILPDPEHFGVFYLKRTYAEEVFNFQGAANQVVGRLVAEFKGRPTEVLRRAELMLEPYGVFTTTPLKDQASNRFLSEEIEGLATFTTILPAIFLAVAALTLNILMTRWSDQQRTVVGTLKALGYSNAQVFGHFLKFGIVIGLAGGLAGCAVGYQLARWVTGVYTEFYEMPGLENRFYLGKSLIGLGVSLVCALLGTAQGARGVLKLKPAEAMRPKPPRRGGAILLERVVWLWQRLSFAWRLVLRDVVRNRLRSLAGLFAAAMGTCILVTGFMMQSAMVFLIDFQFEKVQRYDVELAFKDDRPEDAVAEARRLPGVDHAEPILVVPCTFIHGPYQKKGAITGLQSTARLTIPRDVEGRAIRVPPAGLLMSRKMADLLNVSAGESLVVRPTKGLRRERQVPVAHIVDSYIGLSIYADIEYLNRLINEEAAVTGVQLRLDGDKENRRAMYRELKDTPAVESVYSRHDTIKILTDTLIKTQNMFIGLLVGFAGVIFFGSVLNASLISLAERQSQVAMLRVLGYGPWEVGGMFLRESMTLNLLGTVMGLPLGYWLASLMVALYDTEMFRIPLAFDSQIVVKTFILAGLFGLLAHVFVQRSIHKMDWLEALKVKE